MKLAKTGIKLQWSVEITIVIINQNTVCLPSTVVNLIFTFRSIKLYRSDIFFTQISSTLVPLALCHTAKQPLPTVPISDTRVPLCPCLEHEWSMNG